MTSTVHPPASTGSSPRHSTLSGESSGQTARARSVSIWYLFLIGTSWVVLAISSYANVDADIYWHRILGQFWIETLRVDIAGSDPISFTPGVRDWFPTSWLPEVFYAGVVGLFGYEGILWLRLAVALALVVLLARFLLADFPPWAAASLMLFIGAPAGLVLQDRPQSLSLVLVAAVLPTVSRWLRTGQSPHPFAAVALTWVWANIHGLWVLVPTFMLIVALSRLPQGFKRFTEAGFAAFASFVAAFFTPVGTELPTSLWLVSSSTSQLTEWQATSFGSPVAWGFGSALALVITGMAVSPAPEIRTLLLTLATTVFGFLAYRNAVFASLLLLPVIGLLWSNRAARIVSTLTVRAWTIPLVLALAVGSIVAHWSKQSVIPENSPTRIAAILGNMGPVRVLAPYNSAGYIREFAGNNVRVAIDGRADRYGDRLIREHIDMMKGKAGWRTTLRRIDPDIVIAQRNLPLDDLLVNYGWRKVARDKGLVMLAAP